MNREYLNNFARRILIIKKFSLFFFRNQFSKSANEYQSSVTFQIFPHSRNIFTVSLTKILEKSRIWKDLFVEDFHGKWITGIWEWYWKLLNFRELRFRWRRRGLNVICKLWKNLYSRQNVQADFSGRSTTVRCNHKIYNFRTSKFRINNFLKLFQRMERN